MDPVQEDPPPSRLLKEVFTEPAKYWTDAAPVDNGRLEAMISSGIANEILQLNVKVLLDQLECLKENAIGIAHKVSHRPMQILDTCINDEEGLPDEELCSANYHMYSVFILLNSIARYASKFLYV